MGGRVFHFFFCVRIYSIASKWGTLIHLWMEWSGSDPNRGFRRAIIKYNSPLHYESGHPRDHNWIQNLTFILEILSPKQKINLVRLIYFIHVCVKTENRFL